MVETSGHITKNIKDSKGAHIQKTYNNDNDVIDFYLANRRMEEVIPTESHSFTLLQLRVSSINSYLSIRN